MKLFKDGVIFVEFSDIEYVGIVPRCVSDELEEFYEYGTRIVCFHGKKTIAFWKGRSDIYDYDYISKLNDEKIRAMIDELNKLLNKECNICLGLLHNIMFQKFWENVTDFNKKVEMWKYQKATLERYLNERADYDSFFQQLSL